MIFGFFGFLRKEKRERQKEKGKKTKRKAKKRKRKAKAKKEKVSSVRDIYQKQQTEPDC